MRSYLLRLSKGSFSTGALLVLTFLSGAKLMAVERTWDGGGIGNNWATAANWVGDVAPVAGDTLTFPSGQSKLDLTNNFVANTDFGTINISSAYTLSGNTVDLTNAVNVTTIFPPDLALDLRLLRSSGFFVSATSTFTNSGNIDLFGNVATFAVVGSMTVSGNISGTGTASQLIKTNSGTLRLNGTNTYQGETTVNAGTFVVNGSVVSNVTLNVGATLAGTGTVGRLTGLAGANFHNITPGDNGRGILKVTGATTLNPDTKLIIQLNGNTLGTEYDQLRCSGSINLSNATLSVVRDPAFEPAIGKVFVILTNTTASAITGQFIFYNEGSTPKIDGVTYKVSYVGGSGNDVILTVTALEPQLVAPSWDGGGANRLWSNSTNWSGNVAPVATNNLLFTRGSLNAICTNDLVTDTIFNSLRFTGATITNNYPLLRGNGIRLLSGIFATNLTGGGVIAVETPIKLAASLIFTNNSTNTVVELRSNLVAAPFILSIKGQGSFRTTGTVTGTNNATQISVNGGNLIANGTINGNVAVSLNGEISGVGKIIGTVNASGGGIAPGDGGPGILTVNGAVTLDSGSSATFQLLTNAPGTGYSRLVVSNANISLGSAVLNLFAPATTREVVGTTFTIIDVTASTNIVTGTFVGLPEGGEAIAGPLRLRISYVGGTGNDVTLTIIGVVPTGIPRMQFASANQGDELTFTAPATSSISVTNTFAADSSFDTLSLSDDSSISGGVGGMDIRGNRLRLENGIIGQPSAGQNDSVNFSLVLPLALNGSQTFSNGFRSLMTFGDLDLNGHTLTFEAANIASPGGFLVNGLINGAGNSSIIKNGLKQLALEPSGGVATYAGTTTVNGGVLRLIGNFASTVILNAGTRLDAGGTVGGIQSSGAIIFPLNNLQSSGAITLDAVSTLKMALPGAPTTNSDRLIAGSTVNLGGATLDLTAFSSSLQDTNYIIISKTSVGAVTGTFNGKPEGSEFPLGGRFYRISYVGGDGNDVVIISTNKTPVFTPVSNKTIVEQFLFSFDIDATDPDPADTLVFSLDAGSPTNSSINPATGVFSWTPTDDQGPGTHTIFVRATDNGNPAKAATLSFQITVLETNLPPTITAPASVTNNEKALLTFTVDGSDPDSPPAALSYQLLQSPTGMTLNSTSSASAQVSWTPTEAQGPSTNIVLIRVTETPGGLSSTTSVTVVTREFNLPPTMQALPTVRISVGDFIEQELIASDRDIPTNALTFSLISPPAGATIVSNRFFQWTPAASQFGVRQIRVRCTDSSPEAVNSANLFVDVINVIDVGAVYTVINTNDSGAGSFRVALANLNANNSNNVSTIRFNIPGAGPHKIAPLSDLPPITRPAVIDGYTQPGTRPNALTNGTDAVLLIEISGENNFPSFAGLGWGGNGGGQPVTIRGLCINNYTNSPALNSGCASCSGFGTVGSVIEGCFLGTDTTGTNARPNLFGVRFLQTHDSRIGGPSPAQRNLISGNLQYAILPAEGFDGNNLFNLTIQNNLVGTDRTGTNALGNGGAGIIAGDGGNGGAGFDATGCLIADNVFAANGFSSPGDGYGIEFGGVGNVIVRNKIGVGADGITPLGNNVAGLRIKGSSLIVGGTNATNANIIAYNHGPGVHVAGGTNHAVLGNSIFSNTGLPIDLDPIGNTPNDLGDPDFGVNDLQNFPLISGVLPQPGLLTVSASLNSSNATTYRVEFFHSDNSRDATRFLGFTNVTTDGSGNTAFSVAFPGNFPAGFVSATATDPFTGTSEVSPGVPSASINVRRVGSLVRVFWTRSLTNFVLETNPQIANTNGWTPFAGTLTDDGTNLSRDFAPTNSPLFFRLRSP